MAQHENYLYLIREVGSSNFKIGISTNPMSRAQQLMERIDYEKSICVGGENTHIKNAERAAHKTFYKFKVERRNKNQGFTEWYDDTCTDKVKSFLKDFFELAEWEPIPVHENNVVFSFTSAYKNIMDRNEVIICNLNKVLEQEVQVTYAASSFMLSFPALNIYSEDIKRIKQRYGLFKFRFRNGEGHNSEYTLSGGCSINNSILTLIVNDITELVPEEHKSEHFFWSDLLELYATLNDMIVE